MICTCQNDCTCANEVRRLTSGQIPKPMGDFGGLTNAISAELSKNLNLSVWNSYAEEDFGRMLVEWCALLGDNISTYAAERQKELYLATARRESSLREISAQIGFEPNPALSARAEIVLVSANSVKSKLQSGAAFVSEGYDGIASTDFELLEDTSVDPALNRWEVASIYTARFDNKHIYLDERTKNIRAGEPLVMENGDEIFGVLVGEDESGQFPNGEPYLALSIEDEPSRIQLSKWNGVSLRQVRLFSFRSDIPAVTDVNRQIIVPSLLPQIHKNDLIAVVQGSKVYAAHVKTIKHQLRVEGSGDTAIRIPETVISVENSLPKNKTITLYHSPMAAGRLKGAPKLRLNASDLNSEIPLKTRILPIEPEYVGAFILKDAQNRTMRVEGRLDVNPTNGRAAIITSKREGAQVMEFPIMAYGNLAHVIEGKRVQQNLGQAKGGDFQVFKLGKKPLSFDFIAGDVQPDIRVFVDGIEWRLRKSFYGANSHEPIFVIRASDDGFHYIKFGGFGLGRAPAAGAEITVEYRYGSTGENIEELRINQSRSNGAKVREVFNPFRATGGVKENPADDIKNLAPLHLAAADRVVSPSDFSYAARKLGARGAIAYKEWDTLSRSQSVQLIAIFTTTSEPLDELAMNLRNRLVEMAEEGIVVAVRAAEPVSVSISLSVKREIDANAEHLRTAIVRAFTAPYHGLLSPEKVKIGHSYSRSEILATLAYMKGLEAVNSLAFDGDTKRNQIMLSAYQYVDPQLSVEVM